MTDTTAPIQPKWQLLLGMLPSFNTSLVAIVTAAVSIGGTLATQRLTDKQAEQPKTVTVERIVERPVPMDLGPLNAKMDKVLEQLGQNAGPGRKQKATLK